MVKSFLLSDFTLGALFLIGSRTQEHEPVYINRFNTQRIICIQNITISNFNDVRIQ